MPVLTTALDKPVQLMFLTSMIAPGATALTDASNTLMQMFGQASQALMDTVNANNDPTVVAMNERLTGYKCNVVFPNIGVLWAEGGFANAGTLGNHLQEKLSYTHRLLKRAVDREGQTWTTC
ncbi:hypothetical protein BDZ45DRAFT_755262 [Acephala macrosclerotiorum]|nr:hypothetical protein BDZ45DRAFT_755262 [Acephala macrosclerotiorum]